MHPGTWYLAALGDPDARTRHPDAPVIVPTDWRSWQWPHWPAPLLARMAYHAATLTLPILAATATETGYTPHTFEALLATIHNYIVLEEEGDLRYVLPANRYQRRLQPRLRCTAGSRAAMAVAAAARAIGPFQSRDHYDLSVPRATQIALLHATEACYAIAYAHPRAGPAFERLRILTAMLTAAQQRLERAQCRLRLLSAAETPTQRHDRLTTHIAGLQRALRAAPPPELPDRDIVQTEVFSAVVAAVRPWLRAQTQLRPPQLQVGRLHVMGTDGISREITYGPDGTIQIIHNWRRRQDG